MKVTWIIFINTYEVMPSNKTMPIGFNVLKQLFLINIGTYRRNDDITILFWFLIRKTNLIILIYFNEGNHF